MRGHDAPLLCISDDGMSIFPWRPVHVLIHHMISNLQTNSSLLTGYMCIACRTPKLPGNLLSLTQKRTYPCCNTYKGQGKHGVPRQARSAKPRMPAPECLTVCCMSRQVNSGGYWCDAHTRLSLLVVMLSLTIKSRSKRDSRESGRLMFLCGGMESS